MSDFYRKNSDYIKRVANSDFEEALRRGFWRSVLSWFSQKNNKLLPFDEVRQILPIHGQHYAGLHVVPIEKIVGSVARYNDFDRAFIPTQRHTKSRWVSIDMANLQDVILPPVELYKIGEMYFVKDGNHRVSVAREKGQAFIDAVVIEIVTPLPITNMDNIFDLILHQERKDFYEKTSIDTVRPDSGIILTLPGQYEKLLEHISVHRWFMGERKQSDVTYEEAVAGWYDEVYLPLANVIREQNILKDFPKRTVTDLYLWIIEHLWYLRENYRNEVSLEQAAINFKRLFSKRKFNRIANLFHNLSEIVADVQPSGSGTKVNDEKISEAQNPDEGESSDEPPQSDQ